MTAGEEIAEPPSGVVLFDPPRPLCCPSTAAGCPHATQRRLRRYHFGPGVAESGFRALRRYSVDRSASGRRADPAHGRQPGADGARRTRGRRRSARGMADGARRPAPPCGPGPHRRERSAATVDIRPRPESGSTDRSGRKAVTTIFERFAPGFRDIVVAARRARRAVGRAQREPCRRRHRGRRQHAGARSGGADAAGEPLEHPLPKVYLCSSATPPGGGVHGMSGYYAARTVLRREFGIKRLPGAVALAGRD